MTMEGVESGEVVADVPKEQAMMSQDQVNKVVQRVKAEASEKAKRDAQAQYEQEIAQLKSQPGMGGVQPSIDEEKLFNQFKERLMGDLEQQQERLRREQFEQDMHQVAVSYLDKMDKGKGLYEDFEKITASFEPEAFPKVVQLVSQMDNAADVIYELSKNPSKLVTINDLASRSPKMAQAQLQSLVESIKMNQSAKENNVRTNPPLSKVQPSASAGSDSGAISVSDFKKMPWLRG